MGHNRLIAGLAGHKNRVTPALRQNGGKLRMARPLRRGRITRRVSYPTSLKGLRVMKRGGLGGWCICRGTPPWAYARRACGNSNARLLRLGYAPDMTLGLAGEG